LPVFVFVTAFSFSFYTITKAQEFYVDNTLEDTATTSVMFFVSDNEKQSYYDSIIVPQIYC